MAIFDFTDLYGSGPDAIEFFEAAKALGVEESGEGFRKALDKLVPKKRKG